MFDVNRRLSMLLHEIKSPLNAILGIIELAKMKGTGCEHLNQIKAIAQYMLALSRNLLTGPGRGICEKESFRIREIAEEVLCFFQCERLSKKIDFRHEIDAGADLVICGEPLKLKQILINILANAFKFTEYSGRIELSIKTASNGEKLKSAFIIRDNGTGMSPEFLKNIFQPYAREETNEKDGMGLGLTIVHELVREMGGSVGVKSVKGKGSEFTVSLVFDLIEKQPEEKEFSLKRILLVDDSLINLEIVSLFLREKGAEIEVANNGKIAFDIFAGSEENYYDLILMDMRMPVLSGLEATKAIRALGRKNAREIKIIGFSANSLEEDVSEALACGMDDYISKPIAFENLYRVLAKYL